MGFACAIESNRPNFDIRRLQEIENRQPIIRRKIGINNNGLAWVLLSSTKQGKEAEDKAHKDDSDSALLDAIAAAIPKGTAQGLGYYLKARRGRIVGGLRLRETHDKKQKTWAYRVQEL